MEDFEYKQKTRHLIAAIETISKLPKDPLADKKNNKKQENMLKSSDEFDEQLKKEKEITGQDDKNLKQKNTNQIKEAPSKEMKAQTE